MNAKFNQQLSKQLDLWKLNFFYLGLTVLILLPHLTLGASFIVKPQAVEGFNGLPSLAVHDFAISDSGLLYIASLGGLSVSADQGQTFKTFSMRNHLPVNKLEKVILDGKKIYLISIAGILKGYEGRDFFNPILGWDPAILPKTLAAKGQLIVAIGEAGSIYISKDEGDTFKSITLPCGLKQCQNPSEIKILDEQHFYILTEDSVLFTGDGGVNFKTVGMSPLFRGPILSLDSNGSKSFFTVDGGIYEADLDLTNIVKLDEGKALPSQCVDIHIEGQTLIVKCKEQQRRLYASQDGGKTFELLQLGTATGLNYSCMTDCYVLKGNLLIARTTGGLLVSTDFAKTKASIPSNQGFGTGSINSIMSIADKLYVADTAGLYESSDEGASFQTIRSGNFARLYNVNTQLVVVDYSTIFSYNNQSKQFSEVHIASNIPPSQINAFYMDDDVMILSNLNGVYFQEKNQNQATRWDLPFSDVVKDIQKIDNKWYLVGRAHLVVTEVLGTTQREFKVPGKYLTRVGKCGGNIIALDGTGEIYALNNQGEMVYSLNPDFLGKEMSIYEDVLYIAGDHGLTVSRDCGRSSVQYSSDDLLPDKSASTVFAGELGVWVGTNYGLAQLVN